MCGILSSASTAHSHSFADALPHLMGAVLVVGSLALLWGVCVLVARLVRVLLPATPPLTPKPIAMTASSEPAPTPPADQPTRIPDPIVAVIAAAVASVSRQPVRIVSIRPINNAWERAGRQTVLTSHRIR